MCLGARSVSAQLAYYMDEKGRRVYINAAPKPQPNATTGKNGSSGRYSVLVKKNSPSQERVEEKTEAVQKPAALTVASPAPSAALAARATPPPIDSVIKQTAQRHDMDADLVRAIIQVESNFNPRAVSHKGAMGLMQLVPSTARHLGVNNVFNPVENVDAGVRFLKYLMSAFGGDLKLSLAAYNAGPKAVERHGGVPPYPETKNYIKKIGDLYSVSLSNRDRNRWGIVKYVDENGRVHFTNIP